MCHMIGNAHHMSDALPRVTCRCRRRRGLLWGLLGQERERTSRAWPVARQRGRWPTGALLRDGTDISAMSMDCGKTGFVLKKQLPEGVLYVKLQLGSGCVIGRSFHYSEFD